MRQLTRDLITTGIILTAMTALIAVGIAAYLGWWVL